MVAVEPFDTTYAAEGKCESQAAGTGAMGLSGKAGRGAVAGGGEE